MCTFTGKYTIFQRARPCVCLLHVCACVCICTASHSGVHSLYPLLNCSSKQNHKLFGLRLATLLFLPLPPADVSNVFSRMECVCKSHSNQISLIPGGLNKVAFVCCGCVCVIVCSVSVHTQH